MPPRSPSDRIHLVDALRGLTLAGIAIAHFGEQYLGYLPPSNQPYNVHGTLDGMLDGLAWLFIHGKGFGLFSFLFGLSFALQMERARRRDPAHDFRRRFLWRLAILFAIGWLHGLVYSGDILTVYALLGVVLVCVDKVADRWLLIGAAVLMIGTPRLVQRVVSGPASAGELARDQARSAELATRHWHTLSEGDVPAIVRFNAGEGFRAKWEYQLGVVGRGFQTLALFLVGLWAGRHRVLHEPEAHRRFWKWLLVWAGTLTVAIPLVARGLAAITKALARGAGASAASASQGLAVPDPTRWRFVLGLCAFDAWNGVMTLFYVAAFVALFARPRWQALIARFQPVGRMALSAYVGQSLVGAFVFFGFGLGLLGRFGTSVTLPLGLAVYAVETVACAWWLARFRFGPLEWAWRSLTWLRLERIRLPVDRELKTSA